MEDLNNHDSDFDTDSVFSKTDTETTDNSTETDSVGSDFSDEMIRDIFSEKPVIKNYNLIKELGSGSASNVWLCYDIKKKKYQAIKIQFPEKYDEGLFEAKILSRLKGTKNIMNIHNYFSVSEDGDKFLCSVFDLFYGSLYDLMKYKKYENGFDKTTALNIFGQILNGVKLMHKKHKITHCDLKPDNIFIKGVSDKNKKIIEMYNKMDFHKLYKDELMNVWKAKGNSMTTFNKMPSKLKLKCRINVNKRMIESINKKLNRCDDFKVNKNIFKDPYVCIGDFGLCSEEDEDYNDDFGTVYYRAPEVILLGTITRKVDLWALGCILFELLTGQILFDPSKKKYSRDFNHIVDMIRLCGEFPKKFRKTTKRCKDFFHSDMSLLHDVNTSRVTLNELVDSDVTLDEDSQALILAFLKIDPNHRDL